MKRRARAMAFATLIGCGGGGTERGNATSGGISPSTGSTSPSAGSPSPGSGSGAQASTGNTSGTVFTPAPPPCPDSGPCDVWQSVAPPVDYTYQSLLNYGLQTIDGAKPDAFQTLYVGTCLKGIWKTTNEATSWTKIDTGTFYNNDGSVYAAPPYKTVGNPLDLGRNWTLAVDPTNSAVVYTTAGYGSLSQSLWKSTNGGVDWTEMLGAEGVATSVVVYTVAINPVDHNHLLLTMVSWVGYATDAGLQESLDAGKTWTPHPPTGKPGDAPAGWGHGQYAFFLGENDDGTPDTAGKVWLVTTQLDGIWRTTDGSKTWTKVAQFEMTHGQESLYRSKTTHDLYVGAIGDVYRSTDNGATWAPTGAKQTTADGYGGIVGDGTHIWAMPGNTGVSTAGPYRWETLPEDDTTSTPSASNWSLYSDQMFQDGPMSMVYDPMDHILYASMWSTGLWRLKL